MNVWHGAIKIMVTSIPAIVRNQKDSANKGFNSSDNDRNNDSINDYYNGDEKTLC